jgi:deazaflavin-dependent oxidoreductase (nitroreductase family)
MPLPRFITKVNKAVTNKALIRLSGRPPFAALEHVGRSTGRRYRIPINVFPSGDEFVFALTYGPDTDWVKNVLTAGTAVLHYDGDIIELEDPRMVGWATAGEVLPGLVRALLRLIRVTDFLVMHRTVDDSDGR